VATEFLGPNADCLVRDNDPARRQKVFDHPQAERKTKIKPDGMSNNFTWEPVAPIKGITNGLGHAAKSHRLIAAGLTLRCPYACHVTAQAAIHALRARMKLEGFGGVDIARIDAQVADKVLSHHADTRPNDVMGVQYSVPYALALAAFRDPSNPGSFVGFALDGPEGDLARRVYLAPRDDTAASDRAVQMAVRLHDGRIFGREFFGMFGAADVTVGLARKVHGAHP